MKRNAKGFTLVELIIVISVIAILVGIALPRLRGMIDEGNTAKAASELRALQAAVESYYVHNSKVYPPTGSTWEDLLATVKPTLIATSPKDPFSASGTTQYQYAKDTNGKYYIIWSIGPDTTAGVTGVSTAGAVSGTAGDDIYVSNGSSGTGGF